MPQYSHGNAPAFTFKFEGGLLLTYCVASLLDELTKMAKGHQIDMWMVHCRQRAFADSAFLMNTWIERILMGAMEAVNSTHKDLKRRATVICRHEKEILFVRKRNAKWNLPGGRVEKGETPLQAAMREMAEETGMTFDQLSYVSEYKDDKVIHFLFEATRALHQKPRASNEIDDCRWFTAKELGKRSVRGAIRTLLKHCISDLGKTAAPSRAS